MAGTSTPVLDEDIRLMGVKISNMEPLAANDTMIAASSLIELFNNRASKLPVAVRLGSISCGMPNRLKTFECVTFLGDTPAGGTIRVRIYIDGRYVCDNRLTLSLQPTRHNKVRIPVRRRKGYTIDIEFAGYVDLRGLLVDFEQVHND